MERRAPSPRYPALKIKIDFFKLAFYADLITMILITLILCRLAFATVAPRKDLALSGQPVVMWAASIAAIRPPLQLEFIGAIANFLFEIGIDRALVCGGLTE
jgi:hypothetical protein